MNGYSTGMFGKHRQIPSWEASLCGPCDRWPAGEEIECFYGFSVTAHFEVSAGQTAKGVIVALGGGFGGWTPYSRDGKP